MLQTNEWKTVHVCEIERLLLGGVADNLAHALVESIGSVLTMVAHWKSLEAWRWFRRIDEDDAVLTCQL